MINAVQEDTLAPAPEKDTGDTGGKTNRVPKNTCNVPNTQTQA